MIVSARYRIRDRIGQGSMGALYEAEDTASGRRVALKMIRAERGLSDATMRRFQREARAAMSIASEHVVEVLEAGVDDGLPYLAMELLSGEDLDAVSQRLGPLSPACALRVVGQACMGLERAHEAGVLHRDIKPANIFLARGEGGRITVKLLDFGLAKILAPHSPGGMTSGLTGPGTVLGSPLYMSPEQAQGLKGIDQRTDIWSLGVMLYGLLAGKAPHQGIEDIDDLIFTICTRLPPPVRDVAPWVTSGVAAIVEGALRHDPEVRTPSAAAMLDQIRALLPDGLELTEDMLAPVGEAERGGVTVDVMSAAAFRAASTVISALGRGKLGLASTAVDVREAAATEGGARSLAAEKAATSTEVVAVSEPGLVHAEPPTAPRRPCWPVRAVLVGLVLAFIAAAIVAYRAAW